MNYLLHILVMINIYMILSLSLNLLVGYTGLLSLCHAAFYGVGAYVSTLLMVKVGLNFFLALPVGILGAVLLSLVVAIPSLRLKGDYFVLASLGFQVIVFAVLYNWTGLTRGPYGIAGIPRPSLFSWQIASLPAYFILSAALAALCLVLLWLMVSSPFGRTLKAIREDEVAAEALGKNITHFKILAFAIAGGIASVAGSLYAGYVTYIDPTSFTLLEAVFILSIIVIGGTGNIRGPILGAVLLIILPEILRSLRIPDTVGPNVRQMIYGALIILLMRFRPEGIAGEYQFE